MISKHSRRTTVFSSANLNQSILLVAALHVPVNHFCACARVRGFWSAARRPQDDWILFTVWQTGNACRREGGAAGLMADSSALWSALHSLGTKHPLRDEKRPWTREEFGKWKLPSGGEDGGGWGVDGWTGGRVFWWRRLVDGVVAPAPIFPSVACQSRLYFLSACLPASTICRSLLLPDTFSFQTGHD